ncbi:UDP-N-acetylglucosamine acyltransferase [Amycolatopsis sp. K13G38]|uniref:UDP-N-acetylglucosamine acyltransferase n=1 Tax=Amycolatopsis acididurans TaxID=2724524 RepID=A0ABX1J5B9_9PSEU|nr:UDP-N-acetylglucosamine acyltransferase [Amycolatopsis acididurans]NKQ53491.1 UDP-N-acetylglucosamine acyltransferase [Amycolatopsis acididurans]
MNRIHPTAVLGAGVELGDGNVIGPYTIIRGPAVLGDDNWIGPHVTIGTPAEDRDGPHPAWDDEPAGAGVRIGSRNRIREYVSVHQGTHRETTVGDEGYYLRGSHVAHDCLIGDSVTLASNVVLGGHVHIWSLANLGMGAIVHQRVRIGPGAMIGMGAAVRREVGAFTVSVGNPARVAGLNVVGLTRLGLAEDTIDQLEPWLKGKAPVPPDGLMDQLPAGVSTLVRAWEGRDR